MAAAEAEAAGVLVEVLRVVASDAAMPRAAKRLRYLGVIDAEAGAGEAMQLPLAPTLRFQVVLEDMGVELCVGTVEMAPPASHTLVRRQVPVTPAGVAVARGNNMIVDLEVRLMDVMEAPREVIVAAEAAVGFESRWQRRPSGAPPPSAQPEEVPEVDALQGFQFCQPCVEIDWVRVGNAKLRDLKRQPDLLKALVPDVAFGIVEGPGSGMSGLRVHPYHERAFKAMQLTTQYLLASANVLAAKRDASAKAVAEVKAAAREARDAAELQRRRLRDLRKERAMLDELIDSYSLVEARRSEVEYLAEAHDRLVHEKLLHLRELDDAGELAQLRLDHGLRGELEESGEVPDMRRVVAAPPAALWPQGSLDTLDASPQLRMAAPHVDVESPTIGMGSPGGFGVPGGSPVAGVPLDQSWDG